MSVNTDPLLCAVYIDIHLLIDTAFGCPVINLLPDQANNQKKYNDSSKYNQYPFQCLEKHIQNLFHYVFPFHALGTFQFKPKLHAVIIIVYAISLVHGIHDGSDNGKSDAAAAVLARPRFIHLIEFIP